MSFLNNRLKLEVKSTNNSKLASFTSTTKNTNLYIIPEDSCNYFTVLGSSSETSNIETFISLRNDNINHKIVSFQENNINFGTDILLKGNLVVLGSIISLGYDVLTEDNKFILNNYGASAEKGLNSASEKILIHLKDEIKETSNNLINNINSNFNNLEIALGINNLSLLHNNTFTDVDFNRNFANKTLDDVLQGSSNLFIINDEYTAQGHLTVSGDIFSSNLLTNSVYIYGDLYTPLLYGDGANITNINKSFMNTNNIIEGSSNKYFSYEKVCDIVFSCNISMSNYAYSIEILFNEIINSQQSNISYNYNNLSSNIINDISTDYNNISNYILNFNDNIGAYLNVSSSCYQDFLLNNSNLVSKLINIYNDYILIELSNNSNTITTVINNDINNILFIISNTSNDIYSSMNDYYFTNTQFIKEASNILNNYLNINDNNASNNILETHDLLLNSLIISNMDIYNIKNNISNISLNILDICNININDFITTTSNDIIYNSFNSNNYLNDNKTIIFDEYLTQLSLSNISFSNNILNDYDNVFTEFSNKFNNINQHILNTSNYYYDIITKMYNMVDSSNQEGSNYIYIYSQNLISNITDILTSNTHDTQQQLNNTNEILNNVVNNINTTDILQGSNLYYNDVLFSSSIFTKSLDNIKNGTSNMVINDNKYNDDLRINGDISAINMIVYGDFSSFNENTYNTERVIIENVSNNTALRLIHDGNTDIIGLSNSTNCVFLITGDGNIGVKKNPVEKLDINGVLKADILRGSGKYLTSVNLFNKTTSDIFDNSNSNLYFTNERASIVINSSNANISNYIKDVSQKLNNNIIKNYTGTSNYILNESNIIQNLINNNNNSNYISNNSNLISYIIFNEKIANSNYITVNSNIISSNILNISKSQSNITLELQNISFNNISNYTLTSYGNNLNIISNINYSHSNYVVNISNLFSGILNTYSIKNSNLVSNITNYTYDCNYIISSSNITNNYIDSIRLSQSNIINTLNTDVLNYIDVKLNNIKTSLNVSTVRWEESSNYSCNYYGDIGNRYISYNVSNSNVSVCIGKSTEPDATLDIYTENPALYSIKTNNPIWVKSDLVMSSDIRIKNNIRDINDNDALNKIMSIEPKTYNYIDINRGTEKVIGFIAQQIYDVIPRAITMNKEVIPNIYCYGNILDDCIYLIDYNGIISNKIGLNSVIIIEKDGIKYNDIVVEILGDSIFKIENRSKINDLKIFIYGSYVLDFHALDKNYIYTLSVCSTQDIDRKQKILIDDINNINISSNYSIQSSILTENIDNICVKLNSLTNKFNDVRSSANITSNELYNIDGIINKYDIDGILKTSNIITSITNNISNIQYDNSIIINKNNLIISNNGILMNDIATMETNIENIYKALSNNGIS